MLRFSIFRIPVVVHPIFWIITLMLGTSIGAQEENGPALLVIWLAIVFVSVLIHELGHAIAMRLFGRAARIELVGFGGLTHWGAGPRIGGWRRAAVSLAGPFAGFAVGIPVALFAYFYPQPSGSLLREVLEMLIVVNIGWGVLNLLPILPLDGGHVMESVWTGLFGAKGPQLARLTTLLVAGSLGALAFANQMILPGIFLATFAFRAFTELGRAPADNAIPEMAPPDLALEQRIDRAWKDVQEGEADRAIVALEELFRETRVEAKNSRYLARMAEILAWAHVERGDEEASTSALSSYMPQGFSPSPLLEGRLLVMRGRIAEGLAKLEASSRASSSDFSALVLAASYIDARMPERVPQMVRSIQALSLSSRTLQTIETALFYAEHFAEALDVCQLGWNRWKASEHAFNAACCCARLGRVDEGLGHLEHALRAGFQDDRALNSDPDLAVLRADPRFEALTRIRA